MKYVIVYILIYLIPFMGQGFSQEVLCHFDRPFYLPGQTLHYSIHAPLGNNDSCLVSIQLHHVASVLEQHYLLMLNGHAHGYVRLPFDLKEGQYFFQADVFTSRNGEQINLMSTPISIIDDHLVMEGDDQIATGIPLEPKAHHGVNISVEEIVETRHLTNCKVSVEGGQPGDLISIVVNDESWYLTGSTIRRQLIPQIKDDLLGFLPLRGKRTLINKDPNNKAFLFVFEPDALNCRFNWVQPDGSFLIKVTPFYGAKELYFIDNGSNDIAISIVPSVDLKESELQLVSHESLEQVVEANQARKKIYQLYSRVEESIIEKPVSSKANTILPDYDIDVQDFSIRGKLVDLLKEIITPFKFRKKTNDAFELKVLYEVLDLKYFYDSDPVFFINGVATRDFTYIANLPLQDISRLKIYAHLETLRSLKLVDIGGVGVIDMVDPLFSLPEQLRLPSKIVQGLQIPLQYPIQADIESDIPQLKSLLYWQPDAQLNERGEFNFLLPTSDDNSTFKIEVLCHRLKLQGTQRFEVKYQPGH